MRTERWGRTSRTEGLAKPLQFDLFEFLVAFLSRSLLRRLRASWAFLWRGCRGCFGNLAGARGGLGRRSLRRRSVIINAFLIGIDAESVSTPRMRQNAFIRLGEIVSSALSEGGDEGAFRSLKLKSIVLAIWIGIPDRMIGCSAIIEHRKTYWKRSSCVRILPCFRCWWGVALKRQMLSKLQCSLVRSKC